MGGHIWCTGQDTEVQVCSKCGSAKLKNFGACPVMYERCPPWKISTAGGKNTKTNRAIEAGEVEELKIILDLVRNGICTKGNRRVADLWDAEMRLEKLIQKREGLVRK